MSATLLGVILVMVVIDLLTVIALDAYLPDFKFNKLLDLVIFAGLLVLGLLLYWFSA